MLGIKALDVKEFAPNFRYVLETEIILKCFTKPFSSDGGLKWKWVSGIFYFFPYYFFCRWKSGRVFIIKYPLLTYLI